MSETMKKKIEEWVREGFLPPFQERENENQTNKSITRKRPDYAKFEANNWIKDKNVKILQELDQKGVSLWLEPDGSLSYKINGNIYKRVDKTNAKIVLSNILKRDVSLFTKDALITPKDLILVQKEVFDPHINQEFFKQGYGYFRNIFTPTRFMMLTDKPHKEPKTILRLIRHLVSYNEEHYRYLLNWLAYFWQTLKRPNTAIALKGVQGTGKGIFFEHIIQELFGRHQTIQINDNILRSHFLAPIFEHKLFFNLDEISQGYKDNKRQKNMLKGLVTNSSISLERKHKNIEEPISLYGAVLITSNEAKFLEIEPSDRRYNIFSSNVKLMDRAYLVGSFENLIAAIKEELEDFARYLYHYPVDAYKANHIIKTPEREALIEATTDKYTLFAMAIRNRDLDFFTHLQESYQLTYQEIESSFKNGRVKRKDLAEWFTKTFGEDIHPKALLKELKTRDPFFTKTTKIKGERFFIL